MLLVAEPILGTKRRPHWRTSSIAAGSPWGPACGPSSRRSRDVHDAADPSRSIRARPAFTSFWQPRHRPRRRGPGSIPDLRGDGELRLYAGRDARLRRHPVGAMCRSSRLRTRQRQMHAQDQGRDRDALCRAISRCGGLARLRATADGLLLIEDAAHAPGSTGSAPLATQRPSASTATRT